MDNQMTFSTRWQKNNKSRRTLKFDSPWLYRNVCKNYLLDINVIKSYISFYFAENYIQVRPLSPPYFNHYLSSLFIDSFISFIPFKSMACEPTSFDRTRGTLP